jgi:hypothetical protein
MVDPFEADQSYKNGLPVAVLTRSTVLESMSPTESTAKDQVNEATGRVGSTGSGSGLHPDKPTRVIDANSKTLFENFIFF